MAPKMLVLLNVLLCIAYIKANNEECEPETTTVAVPDLESEECEKNLSVEDEDLEKSGDEEEEDLENSRDEEEEEEEEEKNNEKEEKEEEKKEEEKEEEEEVTSEEKTPQILCMDFNHIALTGDPELKKAIKIIMNYAMKNTKELVDKGVEIADEDVEIVEDGLALAQRIMNGFTNMVQMFGN